MIEIVKYDNIELIKGDCLDAMKMLEDNSVDSIICDPPYGTTACKWDSVKSYRRCLCFLQKTMCL